MMPIANALVRTGLALKFDQMKRATTSYVRDRGEQGQSAVTSYAVAAGLYAAAGIFLIAACLVGVTALFRWIELTYGLFQAFAATGGALLVLTIICALIASRRLKRPAKQFPSLMSRLRVAIKSNPVKPGEIEGVRDTAAAMMLAQGKPTFTPSSPVKSRSPGRYDPQGSPTTGAKAGLVLAATLAGWALARRRNLGQLNNVKR